MAQSHFLISKLYFTLTLYITHSYRKILNLHTLHLTQQKKSVFQTDEVTQCFLYSRYRSRLIVETTYKKYHLYVTSEDYFTNVHA